MRDSDHLTIGWEESGTVGSISGVTDMVSSDSTVRWIPLDSDSWDFRGNLRSGWAELYNKTIKGEYSVTGWRFNCSNTASVNVSGALTDFVFVFLPAWMLGCLSVWVGSGTWCATLVLLSHIGQVSLWLTQCCKRAVPALSAFGAAAG